MYFHFYESQLPHLQNEGKIHASSLGSPAHEMRPCQESSQHTALHTLGFQKLANEFRNIMKKVFCLQKLLFLNFWENRLFKKKIHVKLNYAHCKENNTEKPNEVKIIQNTSI